MTEPLLCFDELVRGDVAALPAALRAGADRLDALEHPTVIKSTGAGTLALAPERKAQSLSGMARRLSQAEAVGPMLVCDLPLSATAKRAATTARTQAAWLRRFAQLLEHMPAAGFDVVDCHRNGVRMAHRDLPALSASQAGQLPGAGAADAEARAWLGQLRRDGARAVRAVRPQTVEQLQPVMLCAFGPGDELVAVAPLNVCRQLLGLLMSGRGRLDLTDAGLRLVAEPSWPVRDDRPWTRWAWTQPRLP